MSYSRPERHSFYNTSLWKRTRAAYFKSVNGLCERCLKAGFVVPGNIVHHLEEITDDNVNDPNVTINLEKLECLCYKHHNKDHKKTDLPTNKGVSFVNGKVVLNYDEEE